MSARKDGKTLPDYKIAEADLEAYRAVYTDLIGFVPPRIQARTDLLARTDPELLSLQEAVRKHAMYPAAFDVKTAQLMLFGMMLVQLVNGARFHAIAARRAGATYEELTAVTGLAFLFRGLSAANLGAEIIQQVVEAEEAGNL